MRKLIKKVALAEALAGQATVAEIEAWKKENPAGIYCIQVGGHAAYFRNPTRKDCNIAASQLEQDAPFDYFENVMRETYLGGSEEVVEDDALYLGALQKVKEKIDGKKAVLVNL